MYTYLLREAVHGTDGFVDAVGVPDSKEEAADRDDDG